MSDRVGTWRNRTACDVLREIRTCHETRNYSYLMGLVEELQHYCTKMEAGLDNKHDIIEWDKKRSILKKEVNELLKHKGELSPEEDKDDSGTAN